MLTPLPNDVAAALAAAELLVAFEALPEAQREEYIRWISRTKVLEIRQERTRHLLADLRAGRTRFRADDA